MKTIGILGGGQLGRMTALAAANLGYKTHIFCPEHDCPASHVAAAFTCADYTNTAALEAFARAVDVITFEFENVPAASLTLLEHITPVYPQPRVLAATQDRLIEKDFLRKCGIHTAPYGQIDSVDALTTTLPRLGLPCILKTRTLGYDGKGQVKITDALPETLEKAWQTINQYPAILEGFVPFICEISIVAARTITGEKALYTVTENKHVNHILDESIVPANVPTLVIEKANAIAHTLLDALEIVGVLAVEMFVTATGDVLVNELAPRPHNSGHWTIDGATTSQFEQLVRCVTKLPLGATTLRAPRVRMKNLLGVDILETAAYLQNPCAKLHVYGKNKVKEGRKMGHVNFV